MRLSYCALTKNLILSKRAERARRRTHDSDAGHSSLCLQEWDGCRAVDRGRQLAVPALGASQIDQLWIGLERLGLGLDRRRLRLALQLDGSCLRGRLQHACVGRA